MPLSHRGSTRTADPDGLAIDVAPTSPPATRATTSRWKDPRLWFGMFMVLAAVVIGARVLAAADDTVPVWQVSHDLAAGMPIGADDLQTTQMHFANPADARNYLPATQTIEPEAHLTRDVAAGDLLPRAALSSAVGDTPHQLPLGVQASGLPVGLRSGDRVDVWALPSVDPAAAIARQGEGQAQTRRVLSDVTVVSMGLPGPGGLTAERQVLVAIADGTQVGSVLNAINGADLVLIRVGG
ncbi:MAG: hypothetical protein ACR2KG_12545 [Nocardioidaceae bacterium]